MRTAPFLQHSHAFLRGTIAKLSFREEQLQGPGTNNTRLRLFRGDGERKRRRRPFNVGEHAWNHVHTRLSPTISPTRAIVRKGERRGMRRRNGGDKKKRIKGERERQVREPMAGIVFRHARIYLEILTAK